MAELKKILLRLPVGIKTTPKCFFVTAEVGEGDKYNYVATLPEGFKGKIELKVHTEVQGSGDPEEVKSDILEFFKKERETIEREIIDMTSNRKETKLFEVA